MNGRRTTVVVGALAVALGLGGCAVGQNAGTQKARTSIDAVNVDLNGGGLQVRNAFVTPVGGATDQVVKGGAVELHFYVYNQQSVPDALVGVTAVDGGTVTLGGIGVVNTTVPIPPQRSTTVGYPTSPTVRISGIPQQHWVGTYLTVTLEFANSGSVTIEAPINDPAYLQNGDEGAVYNSSAP